MYCEESFLLRIWLLFASLITFLTSTIYLFFFTLPHASWMPPVPDWQELAPKFLSQLHEDTDWQPDDMDNVDFLLLISITNFIGSIGYDRSTFYTTVFPYWTTFLTITTIYSLCLVLASVAMICYLTYNYQLSHRFIPIPWIILNTLLVFTLLVGLICLLGDINSTSRLQMEHMLGTKGNYAMVITGLMITILVIWFNILAAYVHMEDKMMEKEKQDRLDQFFRLVDVSFSNPQPSAPPPQQQQQQTPAYSQLQHQHVRHQLQ